MRARALNTLTLDTNSQNKDTKTMKSPKKIKPKPQKLNFFSRKGIDIVIRNKNTNLTLKSAIKSAKSRQIRTTNGGHKVRKTHVCPKDCGYKTTRYRDLVDHICFSHSPDKKLYYTLCCDNKYHRWTSAKRHVLQHFKSKSKKQIDLTKHIKKKRVTVEIWKEGLGDLNNDFARFTVQKIHDERKNGRTKELLTEWLYWTKKDDFSWEPERKIKQIARLKYRNWIENKKSVFLHDVTL